MSPDPHPGATRQPEAELWRSALADIPTVFGRLAYLAALHDPATRQYVHPTLSQALGREDADRAMRHSHQRIFMQWLSFSLAEQKSDLDEYLAGFDGLPARLRYRDLPPRNARDVERQLYLTDLETLIELLNFERENAAPIPRW